MGDMNSPLVSNILSRGVYYSLSS